MRSRGPSVGVMISRVCAGPDRLPESSPFQLGPDAGRARASQWRSLLLR